MKLGRVTNGSCLSSLVATCERIHGAGRSSAHGQELKNTGKSVDELLALLQGSRLIGVHSVPRAAIHRQ